jgi:hypothetical protein
MRPVSEEEQRANCMVSVEAPPRCLRSPITSCQAQLAMPVVDAAVLEEAAVLDGQHRLHQILRNLVVGEQAALGAVGVVAQAGDEQRLQFIAGKRLAVIVGDRLHHPPLMWMVAPSCAW